MVNTPNLGVPTITPNLGVSLTKKRSIWAYPHKITKYAQYDTPNRYAQIGRIYSFIGMAKNGILAFLNNSNDTLSRKKLSIKPYLCVPTIIRSEFNFFASSNTVSTVDPWIVSASDLKFSLKKVLRKPCNLLCSSFNSSARESRIYCGPGS